VSARYAELQKKHVADQHSIQSLSTRSAKRERCHALPTHQVGSRHAGCATSGAFRHRKHAHERRARARWMPAHQGAWRHARMKRSGAELPLCTWSACGGRLNGVAVATVKRGGGGDVPHCVLSRCASEHQRQGVLLASSAAASIGRSTGCNAVARPDCGLLYVFLAALFWPFGGQNALRRPKKVKKAMEAQYNQEKCRGKVAMGTLSQVVYCLLLQTAYDWPKALNACLRKNL
jgi:hypothetical protein